MLYRRNGCHELLLQDGNAHRRLGDAAIAITAYEESRAAFASQEKPAGVSRAFTRLAEMQRAGGNYRQVESLARLALEFTPADNHAARAEALMELAKSTGFLTGMDEGRALAEQAIEEVRQAVRASPCWCTSSLSGASGSLPNRYSMPFGPKRADAG